MLARKKLSSSGVESFSASSSLTSRPATKPARVQASLPPSLTAPTTRVGAGHAHAVAEEEDDAAPAAVLLEGGGGLGQGLLEVGGPGGVLLLEGLQGVGELVPGQELAGQLLGVEVGRPQGGAVLGAHAL